MQAAGAAGAGAADLQGCFWAGLAAAPQPIEGSSQGREHCALPGILTSLKPWQGWQLQGPLCHLL